jgi:hypothetical protein
MQRVTSDKTNFLLHFKILNAFSILNSWVRKYH